MAEAVEAALSKLSLKDLRAVIAESGLSTDDCVDKDDFHARAIESLERLQQPGACLGPVSKPIVEALIGTEEERAERKATERAAAMQSRAEEAAAEGAAARAATEAAQQAFATASSNADRARVEEAAAAAAAAEAAEAAELAEAEAEVATRQVVNLAAQLVGSSVRIVGLKSRPELNGLVGHVLSSTDKGRCNVEVSVADTVEILALKALNLEED